MAHRRNLNRYIEMAIYKGAETQNLMAKNLAEHQAREDDLIQHFSATPGEDRRVILETDLGILCDSFLAAGVMDSKREGGNAIITALTHNLARYMAFSVETGSQPSAVVTAIEARLRKCFLEEMGEPNESQ